MLNPERVFTIAVALGAAVAGAYLNFLPRTLLRLSAAAIVALGYGALARYPIVRSWLGPLGPTLEYTVDIVVALVLGGGVYVGLGLLSKDDQDLPKAEITIGGSYGGYHLRVRNDGATAVFYAQLRFESSPTGLPGGRVTFPASWDQGKGGRTEIATGLDDLILIGVESNWSDGTKFFKVYFTGSDGQQASFERSVIRRSEVGHASAGDQTWSIPLHLLLSADPAFKDGAIEKEYWLSLDGGLKEGRPPATSP